MVVVSWLDIDIKHIVILGWNCFVIHSETDITICAQYDWHRNIFECSIIFSLWRQETITTVFLNRALDRMLIKV